MDDVGHWYGKPINCLDRHELIVIILHLNKEVDELRKDRDAWRKSGDVSKYLREKADGH